MTRKQIIMIGGLGVVLLFVVWYQFLRETPKQREYRENMAKSAKPGATSQAATGTAAAPTSAPHSQFASDTVNVDELLASVKEVDFDYDKHLPPRDPMMPLIGAYSQTSSSGAPVEGSGPGQRDLALEREAHSMVLTGIMWDDKQPLAVIDNNVVGVGYKFPNGITVDSITRTKVNLKVHSRTISIELKEQ